MLEPPDFAIGLAPVTDGTIAAINLESARLQSWNRFWRMPERPGIAETIVEQELLTAQFLGDLDTLDRLETLVSQLVRVNPDAAETSLIAARVASATHRFEEARINLAEARRRGISSDVADSLSFSLDQATGMELDQVLAARRKRAAQPNRWKELVPLGALLADLGEFDEAECIYLRALQDYRDLSPFAPAWVCFELGVLWGERVPTLRMDMAAQWYRAAIDYLPCYVKARVHLAEILLLRGETEGARNLLNPVIASGDPEVCWRLAEVAQSEANTAEVETLTEAARSRFESLLAAHPLAFADHGTDFYLDRGGNPTRAFELAQLNLANRPTLGAFENAVEAALAASEPFAAAELVANASRRWGGSESFRRSPLARMSTHVPAPTNKGADTCSNVERF
jgi:tetratricopeptide (TPR) repeat protein